MTPREALRAYHEEVVAQSSLMDHYQDWTEAERLYAAALAALDQEGGARKAGGDGTGVTPDVIHYVRAIGIVLSSRVEEIANDLARGGNGT